MTAGVYRLGWMVRRGENVSGTKRWIAGVLSRVTPASQRFSSVKERSLLVRADTRPESRRGSTLVARWQRIIFYTVVILLRTSIAPTRDIYFVEAVRLQKKLCTDALSACN